MHCVTWKLCGMTNLKNSNVVMLEKTGKMGDDMVVECDV